MTEDLCCPPGGRQESRPNDCRRAQVVANGDQQGLRPASGEGWDGHGGPEEEGRGGEEGEAGTGAQD